MPRGAASVASHAGGEPASNKLLVTEEQEKSSLQQQRSTLPGVLVECNCATDMDVEGADDAQLRYLNSVVENLQHIGRDALPFLPQHQHSLAWKVKVRQLHRAGRLLQPNQRPPVGSLALQPAKQRRGSHLYRWHPLFRRNTDLGKSRLFRDRQTWQHQHACSEHLARAAEARQVGGLVDEASHQDHRLAAGERLETVVKLPGHVHRIRVGVHRNAGTEWVNTCS